MENSQSPNLCKLASVTFFNSDVFSCSLNVPFFGPVLISKMRYLISLAAFITVKKKKFFSVP